MPVDDKPVYTNVGLSSRSLELASDLERRIQVTKVKGTIIFLQISITLTIQEELEVGKAEVD